MSFLDDLIGSVRVALSGALLPKQQTINFVGATVADDPTNKRTNVTIPASSAAPSVASVSDLKALSTLDGTVTNGQQRSVFGDPVPWIYSSTVGAGTSGDDETYARPADILTANPGRWVRASSAPVLSNIDALRLAPVGQHKTVHVRGYEDIEDGGGNQVFTEDHGGGIFDWRVVDAFNPLPTDDGGINIRVTGHTDGWWKRRFSGDFIDVRWFGGRGDFEQYSAGLNATQDSELIQFFNYAAVDGSTYIGKLLIFLMDDGNEHVCEITDYNPSTHNFTVSPEPTEDATSQPFLYATDNSAAILAAAAYANQLTSTFNVLGYMQRSARLFFSRGTYAVYDDIPTCCGMFGDNATIRGLRPGEGCLFVPVNGDLSGHFDIQGLSISNFRSLLKMWQPTFNGLEGHVTIQNCVLQNIDYVLQNCRNGNLFATLAHCETQNCRAAKGFYATLLLDDLTGTSFGGTCPDNFTSFTLGDFEDGYVWIGGDEDGIDCPQNVGAAVTVMGVGLSPLVDTVGGATTDQCWFKIDRICNLSISNGSRFGGESGGMRLAICSREMDLDALDDRINELFGDLNAHYVLTSGSVHGAADSADVMSAVTYPPAVDEATRIARLNACVASYELHRVKTAGGVHGAADNTNAITYVLAFNNETAMQLAYQLTAAYNLGHRQRLLTVHGAVDATNVVTTPDPFYSSADGTTITVDASSICVSSNFAAIKWNDVAPKVRYVSPSSEVGNFGMIGKAEEWTDEAYAKLQRKYQWLQFALNRVGSVGNHSNVSLPEPTIGSYFPSTQALDASRGFTARERLGFPLGVAATPSGNVFDTSSGTANTGGTGGVLSGLGLATTKYYSTDSDHATGTLVKWLPDTVGAEGWYTASFLYRSMGLGVSSSSYEARNTARGRPVPEEVAIEDTYGEIVSGSYTFWHDNSGVANTHPLTVTYDIPPGGAATNFIEFVEATITRGKCGMYYLPKGGAVPMPNWQLQIVDAAYNPPSLNDGDRDSHTVSATAGTVALGDRVSSISFSVDLQGVNLRAYVSAADTITIVFENETGGTVNLGAGNIIMRIER